MIEKKIYELKINTQFKQLIPPLNEKEFEQLELNIKKMVVENQYACGEI